MTDPRRAAEALAKFHCVPGTMDACQVDHEDPEFLMLCSACQKLADAILAYGAQCAAEARAEGNVSESVFIREFVYPGQPLAYEVMVGYSYATMAEAQELHARVKAKLHGEPAPPSARTDAEEQG